jgi:serine/threonine protein kinase
VTDEATSLVEAGHDADGRPCAFKQLRPAYRDREDLALRLDNERTVLSLLHRVPGVIQLRGVRLVPLVLVLEWADGGSLADRLEAESGPLANGPPIVRRLLSAIAAVHARGVVHRDIKPSNILFVRGRPCLADFGVAAHGVPLRALPPGWEEDDVGTPPWSAPELRADAGTHSAFANDVYGAAMVAYAVCGGDRLPAVFTAALDENPGRRPSIERLIASFR